MTRTGDNIGRDQLRSFVERVLRLKAEQDGLSGDIRDIYAEAKATGFDKTALGKVVAHVRQIEKKGREVVAEQDEYFDVYLHAYLGTDVATHRHEGDQ